MPGDPNIELWTLYALGVSITVLRTYARIVAVGVRELHPDDYLIWFAILIYSAQCTLGYHVGAVAHGMDNSSMSDAQRSALSPGDPEYNMRVIGAKIQVAGWTTAACLLWTLKLCMTFFFLRLMNGLNRYRKRIFVTMGFIGISFLVVILTIYASCRPFNHYWQINPNPGNACQAAVSKPILWVSFILNVTTDVCILLLPIPMLWKSSLRTLKKFAATLVVSAGVLIVVCAILKSVNVIIDPVHGGRLAAEWGTRETFIAVVTTNLPMIFPLMKTWLAPYLPTSLRSSSNNKAYKTPGSGGFVTIGGGGAGNSSRNRNPHSAHHISANMTFNESEERIVKGDGDVKMQDLHANGTPHPNAIMVSKKVSVTTEDRTSERSVESFSRV